MDENQKGNKREGNSSNDEDEMLSDEETEAPDLQAYKFTLENSKLSVEDLKRRPIRHEKENIQTEPKKLYPDLNQNKEKKAQISKTGSLALSHSLILCTVILILSVALLYFLYPFYVRQPSLPSKQLDVQKLMSDLKSRFDGQPKLTYRVIEAAVKKASSKTSESPGIIVLISSRKTKDIADELASRLVQLVSDPLSFVLIDFRYFSSAGQLKKEIDATIRGNLTQEQQVRAVLVRNLDQIPFEAAMIFHGFCDHENAKFKRVLYVMTALVEEESIPPEPKEWDILASKHLTDVWRDSGEDQVASLVSRLTVNVAAVV